VDDAVSFLGATYVVPQAVLDATRHTLRVAGGKRLEAVVLWIASPRVQTAVEIVTELVPPQIAYRSRDGVAVQIPDDVIAEIIAALPAGFAVAARVHSHPSAAYHSSTDDDNALLSHQGAISIVVPDFARAPISLERCSVNERDDEHRWRELSADETLRRFRVT
jgi:hypothetical protein